MFSCCNHGIKGPFTCQAYFITCVRYAETVLGHYIEQPEKF